MRYQRNLVLCLVVVLTFNYIGARHLQREISDAATKTSISLSRPEKTISNDDNFVSKSIFRSSKSKIDIDNKSKVSFNTHLGEFVSSSNKMHQHSDQERAALSTTKQSNHIKAELESSNVIRDGNIHKPDSNKAITDDNDVKDRNGDAVKSKSETKIIAEESDQNKEIHNLNEHKVSFDAKKEKPTQESSVKLHSENDGIVVAKDDSNKLRPTVTVLIEEKNALNHTRRIISSDGNSVVQSRTVHVDDTSIDSKGNYANAIDDTVGSSNIIENNDVPPDTIESNGSPDKEIEHNNYQADIIQQNANNTLNIPEQRDVSSQIVVTENSKDSSRTKEHGSVSPKVVNNNDISSQVDVIENNEDTSRTTERNSVTTDVLSSNEVSSDTMQSNDVSSNIDYKNEDDSINKKDNREIEPDSLEVHEIKEDSPRKSGTGHEHSEGSKNKNAIKSQSIVTDGQTANGNSQPNLAPTMAVLENKHDSKKQLKHAVEPAETNTNNLRNVNNKGDDTTENTQDVHEVETTVVRNTKEMTPDENIEINKNLTTNTVPAVRKPEDVSPLNIFTSDIKYQRFPRPMSLTTLKNKVLGKPLKKLYILEESEKKLFQNVRQLEAIYTIEDEILYVSFLYRFIYSRQCQEVKKFKMGKLVGNTDIAMFEKEMKNGKTERIMFFSERPEDYVFFMSCTDMMTSPYACRDSYYITLDTTHDPPNQFPWAQAANELESKLSITFEDPRFIFNFVLLPCARR